MSATVERGLTAPDLELVRQGAARALRAKASRLRHEHEDIVSDVVERVWIRSCDETQEPLENLEAYAARAALRRASELKATKRGQAVHVEVNDELDQGSPGEEPERVLEQRVQLSRAIAAIRGHFASQDQEIYREHRLNGVTRPELAERYGIAPRTLNRRLSAMDDAVAEVVTCEQIAPPAQRLLRLYSLGRATREQREAIEPAIDADPAYARFVRDVRNTARGAAALAPLGLVGEMADPSVLERALAPIARLKERAIGSASDLAETGATTAAAGGGSRGAGGIAGGGVVAAIAGGGAKVAAVCAGGAAAAICASAVGVLPAVVDPFQLNQPAEERSDDRREASGEPAAPISTGVTPSSGADLYSPPTSNEQSSNNGNSGGGAEGGGSGDGGGGGGSDDATTASATTDEPPVAVQEFDPLAQTDDSGGGSSGGGSGGGGGGSNGLSAAEREFGGP